ncbi:unnamed protein product [Notodromas monacha]|uniref:MOG interacting and ectopic P-granules protein 1 n=1 Tax=Notodromas monacha TaxID=399045 RepID=A0A7R9GAM2_9CRUS|nr:unnamed protein product [Notodromas monacha]CAG0913912.1 unnamed protein product [Notodromas monacha]
MDVASAPEKDASDVAHVPQTDSKVSSPAGNVPSKTDNHETTEKSVGTDTIDVPTECPPLENGLLKTEASLTTVDLTVKCSSLATETCNATVVKEDDDDIIVEQVVHRAANAGSPTKPLNLSKKRPLPELNEIQFKPSKTPPPPPLVKVSKPSSKDSFCDDVNLSDNDCIVEAASFVVPYLYQKNKLSKIPELWKELRSQAGVSCSDEENQSADASKEEPAEKEGVENTYFDEPIGSFLVEIGASLVQEFVDFDHLRLQKRRLEKDGGPNAPAAAHEVIKVMTESLENIKGKNIHLKLDNNRCKSCNFRSTSTTVMAWHDEVPHAGYGNLLRCNFCSFASRNVLETQDHFRITHKRSFRQDKPEAKFQCSYCPWEDKHKPRFKRHLELCEKKFIAERNCEINAEWEPAGKLPVPPPLKPTPTTISRNSLSSSNSAAAQARSTYQFHPLMPKEHVKFANSYIAATSKPTRAPKPIINQGNPQQGHGRLGSIPTPMMAANQPVPQRPASSLTKGSKPVIESNYSRILWSQQLQQQNVSWLNSLQTNGQGVAMAGGTSISLVPSGGGGSNKKSLFPSSSVTIRPIPGSTPEADPGLSSSSSKNSPQINFPFTLPSSLSIQSLKSSAGSGGKVSSKQTPKGAELSRAGPSPSVSITPLPNSGGPKRPQTSAGSSTNKRTAGAAPGKFRAGADGRTNVQGADSFVVCEICDGYIKDLEQLGNHLKWIHKVSLHPRLLQSRPPLNCQKCQFRFFTDQGLERHLLGTHGLVTSSMQDAANKNQDSGRCPICGKMYQWKLLAHVSKDHKKNLKPAHLSYKCTVCTATFSMYGQFEQHVYNEHSSLAKKQAAASKAQQKDAAETPAVSEPPASKVPLPVHISDEITIIPQPRAGVASSSATTGQERGASGRKAKLMTPVKRQRPSEVPQLPELKRLKN